jgi:hypothetical protein
MEHEVEQGRIDEEPTWTHTMGRAESNAKTRRRKEIRFFFAPLAYLFAFFEEGKKELGETGTPTMGAELPKSRSRLRRAVPATVHPPTLMHRFGTPATRFRVPHGVIAS